MVLGAGIPVRANAKREKKKMGFGDYVAEMHEWQAEEAAAAEADEAANKRIPKSEQKEAAEQRAQQQHRRLLQRDHLQPLVDLAYSESMIVQRSAIGVLATLSINADNKEILIQAGSLRPLVASCASTADIAVRRSALQAIAHMTAQSEDTRSKLCAVPGGLRSVVDGVFSKDTASRLAAAECIVNIASSMRMRGKLVESDVLPAIATLLVAKLPELKRCGMVALQKLARSHTGNGAAAVMTAEDPEGDGFADEILNEGVVPPLLTLLRGGPTIEEDLRTHAMRAIYEMSNANDEVKIKLCREHGDLLKVVVGLMLLDEHPGGATQRETCRVVQLLAQISLNLPLLIRSGILAALSVLSRAENVGKKQVAANLLHRLAADRDCQKMLLEAGGARTLCNLARATLPRKVARPAVSAMKLLATQPACIVPLLESGAGTCLTALATSSDPELRQDGCKALADMLGIEVKDPMRVADLLLHQGALGVFLAAAYSRDRQTQLSASRGLLYVAQRSKTHARIIAKKGAARALSALLLSREDVLVNAVTAIYEITKALVAVEGKEEKSRKKKASVRGVLEIGVVGTAKELWARLNDDAGMPAAQLMRVARVQDSGVRGDEDESSGSLGLGEMAKAILRNLKPDALTLVEQDLPKAVYDPHAVAERQCRVKMIEKIQARFREALLDAKKGVNRGDRRRGSSFMAAVRGAQQASAAEKASPRERAANAAKASPIVPGSIAAAMALPGSARDLAKVLSATSDGRFVKKAAKQLFSDENPGSPGSPEAGGALSPRPPTTPRPAVGGRTPGGRTPARPMSASPRVR